MSETEQASFQRNRLHWILEWLLLVSIMFIYAGDAPPMVNEAHYLVKAKNFWQPDWCAADLFASSGKAHVVFYAVFGWPAKYFSLETTAWIGRSVGWSILSVGLMRLSGAFFRDRFASLLLITIWIAAIEYGNLAGEWVIGGIEGKVPAYGLVLAAIAELAHRNWNRVWVLLGLASAFHVLTGGWSVIAAMFAWIICEWRKPDRHPLLTRWLFLGGTISLAGVVPAVQLMLGSSATEATEAAKIYSFFRIRHHLLPSDFLTWWYIRHGIVLAILIVFARSRIARSDKERRFLALVGGAGLIALIGLLIGTLAPFFPDTAARLLRYYWFRLSDAIIPLGMSMMVLMAFYDPQNPLRKLAKTVVVVACLLVGYSSVERMVQGVPPSVNNRLLGWDMDADAATRSSVFEDWLLVCDWAAMSTPIDEVFLTPRHQQTFKWYSGRSEVVNWKDVPQDASSLIEWKKRFQEVFPDRLGATRTSINYQALREFRRRYGVRYMIVDRRVVGEHLPMVRVYPTKSVDNANYAVYELPE